MPRKSASQRATGLEDGYNPDGPFRQPVRHACARCRRHAPDRQMLPLESLPDTWYCGTCWTTLALGIAQRQARATALDSYYRSHYGIGVDEYARLYSEQHGACGVCLTAAADLERPLAVDHDHASGAVRGLLCLQCNTALGLFRDDPVSLARAIVYLGKRSLHSVDRQAPKG